MNSLWDILIFLGLVMKESTLYYIVILWDHRRICGTSLTETSSCGPWLYHEYIRGADSLHLVSTCTGKLVQLGFWCSYWRSRCEGTASFARSQVLTVVPLRYLVFRHVKPCSYISTARRTHNTIIPRNFRKYWPQRIVARTRTTLTLNSG
jgi:hypothetical protein